MTAVPTSAIVHDFFVQDGGAESTAIELARLLPEASIHTSFFDAGRFGDRIDPSRVHTWPLQRVGALAPHFRALLPLYPAWFGSLRLDTDLVISSSIAFTAAVRTPPGSTHIAYVYTPMRYAWDLDTYLRASSAGRFARRASRLLRPTLQRWDRHTARRPDRVIAISGTVQERIRRVWRRSSTVIHPPVHVDEIALSTEHDGYLLVAARLLGYRRIDLAVEACTRLGVDLVVVGDGPERGRLETLAGPTVRFLGHVSRPDLVRHLERCRAYIVPGIEDFGIAPVEAMAAGKPVIAYRGGGATETVTDGVTGVFFDEPNVTALIDAVEAVEHLRTPAQDIRGHARRFDVAVFRSRWRTLLDDLGVA